MPLLSAIEGALPGTAGEEAALCGLGRLRCGGSLKLAGIPDGPGDCTEGPAGPLGPPFGCACPGFGAFARDNENAFILAAISEFIWGGPLFGRGPPAGLLAALRLPSGVEDGVILAVVAEVMSDELRGDIWLRPGLSRGGGDEASDAESGEEGDAKGLSSLSVMVGQRRRGCGVLVEGGGGEGVPGGVRSALSSATTLVIRSFSRVVAVLANVEYSQSACQDAELAES